MLFTYWLVHTYPVIVNEDTEEEWMHPEWTAKTLLLRRDCADDLVDL